MIPLQEDGDLLIPAAILTFQSHRCSEITVFPIYIHVTPQRPTLYMHSVDMGSR